MTTKEAAKDSLRYTLMSLSRCPGDEATVLSAFLDEFEPIIDGWNMRLAELDRARSEAIEKASLEDL